MRHHTIPQHKTQNIRTWEDDPGTPPSARAPIQRPTPDLDRQPLPVGVAGPRPRQSGDFPGTPEFRYWAAADALSRSTGFWGPLMPDGLTWHPTVGRALTAELDVGDDLNAFYDRQGLSFFHHTVAGVTVHSGESSEIVCHEVGHAVLDTLCPQLWSAASAEAAALHESFGDISAILSALSVESLVDGALVETQGDPGKSSRLSRLAEELGWAIRQQAPGAVDPDCLRNAANDFFYKDPVGLPPNAPAGQLSSEPHSFSRVFTGAFLEALAGVYRQQQNRDTTGLAQAGEVMGRLLVAGLTATPVVPGIFAQTAAHMITADQALYGGEHSPALRAAFVRHGIMAPSTAASVTEAAPRFAAAVSDAASGSGPAREETLSDVTVPAEHYGLTEEFAVHAPTQPPRFAVSGADPATGSLRPAEPARAAVSFVEDLFRQGRVAVPDDYLTQNATLIDGARPRTHEITRDLRSGQLTLDRVLLTVV
ncbi:hypothetical protein RKE29_17880 [Streptomyces sp. B1866]|uniref:hypothetical protein n=1 Tax=Streptomyces sp. B1866 TaxID=3075431 RepID=UPI00288E16A2|nr:hypothetical protein [Streptomyces sp. B1866]MDT3398495.1 hypothetical protein [Streptomyces sp. B1866]